MSTRPNEFCECGKPISDGRRCPWCGEVYPTETEEMIDQEWEELQRSVKKV